MAPTGTNYRKLLKDIADNLTFSDVGSLKFVCRGKIGAAALDKVPNGEPLKLFKLLEERVLISAENLTWLRGILKQIQRIDLVVKIPDEFCQQSSIDVVDSGEMVGANPLSSGMVSPDVVPPYRVLLKVVADELTSDNISEMKFLLDVPDGIGEKLQDGQSLLTHLEGNGKLSENNFTDLKDLLSDVYRRDLIKKIEDFSINEAPQPIPPPSPGRDPDSCYPMQRPHGFALIINIQTFKGNTKDEGLPLSIRRGSDVDIKNLKDLWEQLGFIVETHENLKAHQICGVIDTMAEKINKNQGSSCFVCCIMTHGAMGKIYGSDSKHVNIKYITDLFKEAKCPALAGKPKLFFIQACRGRWQLGATETGSTNATTDVTNTATPGIGATHTTTQETSATSGLDVDAFPAEATAAAADDNQYDNINDSMFRHNADPNEAHFLLGYSTAPGYVSFRSVDHGTWYVNALVKIFSKYHMSEDVMHMMVRVNGKVDKAYTSKGYKQCPAPVFTLAKKIYF